MIMRFVRTGKRAILLISGSRKHRLTIDFHVTPTMIIIMVLEKWVWSRAA